MKKAAIAAAVAGLSIPFLAYLINALAPGGWFPEWLPYVWPTAVFLIGASGGFWLIMLIASALLNGAIYATLAVVLVAVISSGRRSN